MAWFRISKYDSRFRINGVYSKDEWTSISDIGKEYDGKRFDLSEYRQIENHYLAFLRTLWLELNVSEVQVTALEDYNHAAPYTNGTWLHCVDDMINVARGCLREAYWCELNSDRMRIRFGYDYYMYVCSPLDFQKITGIASAYGLYVEDKSPLTSM